MNRLNSSTYEMSSRRKEPEISRPCPSLLLARLALETMRSQAEQVVSQVQLDYLMENFV